MSKQELTSLLQQYLSKDISAAQKQALAALIANATDEEQIRSSLEEIWNEYQPADALSTQNSEAYYNRILQQIKQQPAAPVHRVHFLRRSWFRIAAAAVVIIAAGVISYWLLPSKPAGQQQAKTNTPANEKNINKYLTLADGSKVLLHAGSRLSYPPAFNGSTREVTLTGEAFFDVAHNDAMPFIIHSGNIKTTVLGTAFNIKAWPAETEVTVTVTRGKVKVENERGVLGIITPDQQLSVNTQNNQLKQEAVNAELELPWKNKEYTMDNVTIDEAITELAFRYNIIIETGANEKPGNCRFTASFKQDESLEYVLNVVCKIYQASWKRVNDKIVITNINCTE
ncbi:FecR family protein [Niastella sp. OAS944]|uniref:FecR family protein n=1 Tax=Niastella sp. OAS944 TaxID=2664089 RepID=UPI003482859E|nr:ferric-dicitrate binding protein FerR (iron transport regulator) [Chitinophagaceae bacterium OAS944]